MAVDIFLKIDPIKGEAKDKSHPNEMDVLAWSWGVSNSGSAHVGGGGGAGKANVHDLSFTKFIDMASADLFEAACNGKHFKEAVLVVRKAGEKPLEYLTITMQEVIITSVSTGGSGGEDRLTENVTLNFAKVKMKYVKQSATGSAEGDVTKGWDIQANTTWS